MHAQSRMAPRRVLNMGDYVESLSQKMSDNVQPYLIRKQSANLIKAFLHEESTFESWTRVARRYKINVAENVQKTIDDYVPELCRLATEIALDFSMVGDWEGIFETLKQLEHMNTILDLSLSKKIVAGTSKAINEGDSDAIKDAASFWISVCKEEWDIQGRQSYIRFNELARIHNRIIQSNLVELVPMFLESLLRIRESCMPILKEDGDCLDHIALVVGGDIIIPLVLKFVDAKILETDWRSRFAALMALGSLINESSENNLSPTMSQIIRHRLDDILRAMADDNCHVRYSAARALKKVLQCNNFDIVTPNNCVRIFDTLDKGLCDIDQQVEELAREGSDFLNQRLSGDALRVLTNYNPSEFCTERELKDYMVGALSCSAEVRKEAERHITHFQNRNLLEFWRILCEELSDEVRPPEYRRFAAILIKNSMDGRDWMGLRSAPRSELRASLLNNLSSSSRIARNGAAHIVAKIIPLEPDLVGILLKCMSEQHNNAVLKQGVMQTLGHVFEEMPSVQFEVNAVIRALIQEMDSSEEIDVRVSATRALYNAIEFARVDVGYDMERDMVRALCKCAVADDKELRQCSFQCLVSAASVYYDILGPYIDEIIEVTANAIKADEEAVALQAIELWSSICDRVLELQENDPPHHLKFIKKALPMLVPQLLETLLRQNEEAGDWNMVMAGRTCLGLVSEVVGDLVVPPVVAFVDENISKRDPRYREAAICAFGCILEGPNVHLLSQLVLSRLNILLNERSRCMKVYTLSRILSLRELRQAAGFSMYTLKWILFNLHIGLDNDAPHVAEQVCLAIGYLAQGTEDVGQSSSLMTPLVPFIFRTLIATAKRGDSRGSNLRSSACEAMKHAVRCLGSSDLSQVVRELLPAIKSQFDMKFIEPNGQKQVDLEASLCSVLRAIIQRLSNTDETKHVILEEADWIMRTLFSMLGRPDSIVVQNEALMAVSAVAYGIGPEFNQYMPELNNHLLPGLRRIEEIEICSATFGDICRVLGEKILRYCDRVMEILIDMLVTTTLESSVKASIFACFREIADAIGSQHFEKFRNFVEITKMQ